MMLHIVYEMKKITSEKEVWQLLNLIYTENSKPESGRPSEWPENIWFTLFRHSKYTSFEAGDPFGK